jgi:hypothetical protein
VWQFHLDRTNTVEEVRSFALTQISGVVIVLLLCKKVLRPFHSTIFVEQEHETSHLYMMIHSSLIVRSIP